MARPNDAVQAVVWLHPNLGEIRESLCGPHVSQVLHALRMLGVGAVGISTGAGVPCGRCANPGREPRDFLKRMRS